MENTKETMPMMPIGKPMLCQVVMPVQANEMPTARASMLVATAKVSITDKRVGSKWWCASSSKLSFIIRMPKMASKPKAIQWSNFSII